MNHGEKGAILPDQAPVVTTEEQRARARLLVVASAKGLTQEEKVADARELISALGL